MKVLACLSRKGGVGKTLAVRSIAVQALIDGTRSAILDTDPQATAALWAKRRLHSAPAVERLGSSSVEEALERFKRAGAELIVIDSPPHNQPLMNVITAASTGCLIISGTGAEDVEQVGDTVRLVSQIRRPAAILLNRTQPRTAALSAAKGALAAFDVQTCPVTITQAVAHVYASSEGLSASERDPGSRAAQELADLYTWLKKESFV